MKYKVVNADILHNGKLYREGSEIELSEEWARVLKPFLKPKKAKKNNSGKSNK